MFLAVKNYKNNKNRKTASLKQLGVDIIDKDTVNDYDNTLVKMVRDDVVVIHSVKTVTKSGYWTIMDIENKCEKDIKAFIPRGSVIGAHDAFREVQNLATPTDNHIELKGNERRGI